MELYVRIKPYYEFVVCQYHARHDRVVSSTIVLAETGVDMDIFDAKISVFLVHFSANNESAGKKKSLSSIAKAAIT